MANDFIDNLNHGKYAVINLHLLNLGGSASITTPEALAEAILKNPEIVSFGGAGKDDEFFVLKLKDVHSTAALAAYAASSIETNVALSAEVSEMAQRSGVNHPCAKTPD